MYQQTDVPAVGNDGKGGEDDEEDGDSRHHHHNVQIDSFMIRPKIKSKYKSPNKKIVGFFR